MYFFLNVQRSVEKGTLTRKIELIIFYGEVSVTLDWAMVGERADLSILERHGKLLW